MLSDIVLDTNVLCHAGNPGEAYFASAAQLVYRLMDSNTNVCVDEGFDLVEAHNRSFICGEYLRHLIPGSLGFVFLTHAAANKRISQLRRYPNQTIKAKIEQLIRNKTDRKFLGVACGSVSRTLVSHDFTDFQQTKREHIERDLSVVVIEAGSCIGRLV